MNATTTCTADELRVGDILPTIEMMKIESIDFEGSGLLVSGRGIVGKVPPIPFLRSTFVAVIRF